MEQKLPRHDPAGSILKYLLSAAPQGILATIYSPLARPGWRHGFKKARSEACSPPKLIPA